MAYMIGEKGPYPSKAGDFCGNHYPDSEPPMSCQDMRSPETRKAAIKRYKAYLAKMRFGKPSSCETGTSSEMDSQGWVGLYLKEDSSRTLFAGEVEIETDALTEVVVSREPPSARP